MISHRYLTNLNIWILCMYQFVGVLFWSCSVCYWLFSVYIKGNINSIMLPVQFVQQCLPHHQMSEQAYQWVQHLVDMSHISQDRLITRSEIPICFSKQVKDKRTGISSVARLTKSTALPTAQEVSKWCKILWSVFMIFSFSNTERHRNTVILI